ncbi:MAG: cation:proton antiporter [Firmicutes bacterium]|nr:cation:proton antiporter [Bacillota bacterium]
MADWTTMIITLITGLLIFLSLARTLSSPGVTDKLVAVNIITTKTIILIVLLSELFESWFYLDVALVYALCSYAATVAVLKGQVRQRLD